ncbi:MAG TPA: serine/threonine-protein kinase [Thermoanaerobaculia bacterium]
MTEPRNAVPAAPLPRGSRLGPYEVVGPLGAGGMGLVIRAVDTRLGREVAIKLLYGDAVKDEKRLRRLVGEARAVSALSHPNIVTLFEMGESPRGPYLVTELVEGETVRALLLRGPLPLSLALDVAIQTLAGLAKAHAIGLVHRDLKPENLMLTRDGFLKILDFGLAKLARPDLDDTDPAKRRLRLDMPTTEKGMIVGTAAYMSPEQVRAEPVSAASDLFSVAVVLYEMVTGRNPFQRSRPEETLVAVLRESPDPIEPGLPASAQLETILGKALAKQPAERFQSARELEEALRTLRRSVDSGEEPLRDVPARLRTPVPRSDEGTPERPRRRGLWIAGLLALLIAAGGATWCQSGSPAPQSAAPTNTHPQKGTP